MTTQPTPPRSPCTSSPGARRWLALVALAALLWLAPACDDDGGGDGQGALTDAGDDSSGATGQDATATDPDGTSGADGGDDSGDASTQDPTPRFAFGVDPSQTVSAGPFPSNLYLSGGKVALASMADDPVVGTLGKAEILTAYSAYINDREGFSFAAPAFFFLQGEGAVDEASLVGRVRIITLSGPEAGREVAAQAFWSPHPRAVGVMAAWGDYMMAESTYAVLITQGVTANGEVIAQPAAVADVLKDAAPNEAASAAHAAFAPLRAWMAQEGVSAEQVVVATVFTTEPVRAYGDKLFAAVDAFPLKPITARVRYDAQAGAFVEATQATTPQEVAARMGEPAAPFEHYPGHWEGGRDRAAAISGSRYEGGTLHAGIGAIYSGSVEVPAFNFLELEGDAVNHILRGGPTDAVFGYEITALMPFTLYLCEQHLADPTALPVAVFSHGGGVSRLDAVAMANLNCRSGVATIAADMVFHGGRSAQTYISRDRLLVPTGEDAVNGYTGRGVGDHTPDFIGEGAGATGSVGQLFGADSGLDPLVVEANILTVSSDTYALARYLREGDWSGVAPGVTFAPGMIFHQSLSFGSSLTTPLIAMRDVFQGVVTSVGTGMVLPNIAMAPSNGDAASALAWLLLGLQRSSSTLELQAGSYKDWTLSMHLWLYERADPLAYAPYVLRHRATGGDPSVLSTGNSWDETLHNSFQLSFVAAYGLGTLHDGGDWRLDPSIPGAERIEAAEALPGADISLNVNHGGRSYTAVNFFHSTSCHAQLITNLCINNFQHPYPPLIELPSPTVALSHICEIHHQIKGFTDSLLGGGRFATVQPPAGDCASLYGDPPP